MWIMMNDSFLSIVEDEANPDHLLVRARREEDIQSVFDHSLEIKIEHTPDRDYAYRASIVRVLVSAVLAERMAKISYPNFKDSVDDNQLHNLYVKVWGIMRGWTKR